MAFERNMCEIVDCTSNDLCRQPSLVRFDLGVQQEDNLKCAIYQNRVDHKKRILALPTTNKLYLGSRIDNESARCQTLIFVRSAGSNKVRLYTPDQYLVSRKYEQDSNLDTQVDITVTAEEDASASTPITEDRYNLSKVFGSKRAKKFAEVALRNRANTSTNEGKLLETVANTSVELDSVISPTRESDLSLNQCMPHCNRQAKRAEEVYKKEDLLSGHEWDSLKSEVAKVMADPPGCGSTDSEQYTAFLKSAFAMSVADNSETRVQLLLYADCIIYFLAVDIHRLKSKAIEYELCPYSQLIGSKILRNFTLETKIGRFRPQSMRDKAVCYVMVLLLLANDLTFDLKTLAESLPGGFGMTKLQLLAKLVGTVRSITGDNIYKLKLPLPPVPTIALPRRSKH